MDLDTLGGKKLKPPVIANDRTEFEEHDISKGSGWFLTILGWMTIVPGIALIVTNAHIIAGIIFIVTGLYTSWTGMGSVRLFKQK